jgi:hypothetical protein
MKHSSALKNTAQAILLAGLAYGVSGAVQAQMGGPGSVGGLGQQGAPAGEFPGEGSALDLFRTPPQQEGVTTIEPGKQTVPKDSSGVAQPHPLGQPSPAGPADPAVQPIPPLGPDGQ